MELELKGKVALVTGAGSPIGFGRAIALTLAREGCDIIASDINLEEAEQAAAEVEALGRKAVAIKADVSNSAEVNDMVKAALGQFGRIDILVNNAGLGMPLKLFVESTEAEWDVNINIHFKGVLNCSKAVLNHMIERKSGKIINISSVAGISGGRGGAAVYSAVKAAVMCFTKALAQETAPLGINVNSVAPGLADTGFPRRSNLPREEMQRYAATIAVRRLTTPQDIANAVAFLASDVSSDIVGQILLVSGNV